MARRRRQQSQLEMNFDGLTDSVTNLVGALILLVVLLIGLTHELTAPAASASAAAAAGKEAIDDDSLAGMLQRIEILRAQTAQAEQAIAIAQKKYDLLLVQAEEILAVEARPE